ncbi:MAG: hypothetical protein HOE90_20035 [Bacteriovoracaceae bacterium]|nr:hypothetical protein [Bacteriovoracaceae bacterium]
MDSLENQKEFRHSMASQNAMATPLWEVLGHLIEYPNSENISRFEELMAPVKNFTPKLAEKFESFVEFTKNKSIRELEEFYVPIFDVHGISCLDVGYVLFGEEYKRGEFLVNISRLQRESNNEYGPELADHLPYLLKLLPKMKSGEEKTELVELILIPAVEKMKEALVNLKGAKSIYGIPFLVIYEFLKLELETLSRGSSC